MDQLTEVLDSAIERAPDKVAFSCRGETLTYAELDRLANQLANTLIERGCATGDRVGIYMEKSLQSAVAIYGILRAGAVYVPLDPKAPASLTNRIIESCEISQLITSPTQTKRTAALNSIDSFTAVIGADESALPSAISWPQIESAPYSAPNPDVSVTDPAYIIFTSGSTGEPKGIVHTHESAVAFVQMAAELYGLTAEDRLSNFPPLHFDQSIFDYFAGALVAATTVILTEPEQIVPASLSERIQEEQLTIWYSVPFALIQLLLRGALDQRDINLRWVIFGGEPFPLRHLKDLMDLWPSAQFSNCYGPAETNQCTYYTVEPLSAEAVANDARIPIGVPCAGVETMVVDDHDVQVPAGTEGELLVSGPTTMSHYWGRSPNDADTFLIVDDAPNPAKRFYRTGDIVIEDDAMFDFLGRRDRQIKTRGFRVELDEVEAAFESHFDVAIAGAYPVADPSGGVMVHIALQLAESTSGDLAVIKKHAMARLPRHAMPSLFTTIDAFPRTTSGKIDYRALSASQEVS